MSTMPPPESSVTMTNPTSTLYGIPGLKLVIPAMKMGLLSCRQMYQAASCHARASTRTNSPGNDDPPLAQHVAEAASRQRFFHPCIDPGTASCLAPPSACDSPGWRKRLTVNAVRLYFSGGSGWPRTNDQAIMNLLSKEVTISDND